MSHQLPSIAALETYSLCAQSLELELREVRNQREVLREEYGFAFKSKKGEEGAAYCSCGSCGASQICLLLQGAKRMHKTITH